MSIVSNNYYQQGTPAKTYGTGNPGSTWHGAGGGIHQENALQIPRFRLAAKTASDLRGAVKPDDLAGTLQMMPSGPNGLSA